MGVIRLAALISAAVLLAACSKAPSTPDAQVATPAAAAPARAQEWKKADALLANGDPRGAAEASIRSISGEADSWEAWNTLSLAYRRLGYYTAAYDAGIRAVALKPDATSTNFNTAVALLKADPERAKEAEFLLRRAGTSDDAVYWFAMSLAMQGEERRPAAQQAFRNVLKQYPDDKEAKMALAALETDMDMDGKPDAIKKVDGHPTVELAGGKAIARADADWGGPFNVVVSDIGAPYPGLFVYAPKMTWLYMYDPGTGALRQVGDMMYAGSWNDATKVLHTSAVDRDTGIEYWSDWAWQNGQWKSIRSGSEGAKGSELPPPGDVVGLAAGLLQGDVKRFASDDASRAVYAKLDALRGSRAYVYPMLMQSKDGWVISVYGPDGQPLGQISAEVDAKWQITVGK